MSAEIDEKVVQMQFDNRQFEENVSTSLNTLDKLKEGLNFDGVEDSFDTITEASNSVNFGVISQALGEVHQKFSALEIIAITALQNITNSAINTGRNLLKSLSVDQVTAGFQKYESTTTSVQTIMSATGDSIEEVTDQLERLNWFTDETSYSFTDMVSNIGKFTGAGVDLETARIAMQGIATEAALAGQNSQAASRAMYNFAQAMGTGAVKLMDWRSIENANMATIDFKTNIIESAAALGTLKKNEDGVYETLRGTTVSANDFNSALSEGWFTSEVLIDSLKKYGGYAEELYEYQLANGIDTASEAMASFREHIDDAEKGTSKLGKSSLSTAERLAMLDGNGLKNLGEGTESLGKRAFRAAQEAKTLSDAIDSVKDAASTGWMTAFQTIFGNYEEARVLWTDLANELYDVFVGPLNTINELLSGWKDLGGRDILIDALWNGFHSLVDIINTFKEAFNDVFFGGVGRNSEQLVRFTEGFANFIEKIKLSEQSLENLKKVLELVFTPFSLLRNLILSVSDVLGIIFNKTSDLRAKVFDTIGNIAEKITDAIWSFEENYISMKKVYDFFENFTEVLSNVLSKTIDIGKDFVEVIQKMFDSFKDGGVKSKIDSIIEKFKALKDAIKIDTESVKDNGIFKTIEEIFNAITKVFDKTSDANGTFSSLFSNIEQTISNSKVVDILKGILDDVASFAEGVVSSAANVVVYTAEVLVTSISDIVDSIADSADSIAQSIMDVIMAVLRTIDSSISEIVSVLLDIVSKAMDALLDSDIVEKIYGWILKLLDDVVLFATDYASDIIDRLLSLVKTIFSTLWSKIEELIGDSPIFQFLKNTWEDTIKPFLDELWQGLNRFFSNLNGDDVEQGVDILAKGGIAFAIIDFIKSLKDSVDRSKGLSDVVDKVKDTLDGLTGVFENLQNKIKPDKLKDVGVAIALLAASIVAISLVDPDSLGRSVGAISVMMAELVGAMALLQGLNSATSNKVFAVSGQGIYKASNASDPKSIVGSLIAFAASVLILAEAVAKLAEFDFAHLTRAMIAVTDLMIEMVAVSKIMGNSSGSVALAKESAKAMIEFAASVLLMTLSVKSLAELSWEELGKGLAGVTVLLGELVAAAVIVASNKGLAEEAKTGAEAMLIMSASMLLMTGSLKSLAELSWEQMAVGLVGMTASLGLLVGATEILAKTNKPVEAIESAAALLIVSMSLHNVANALEEMGSMSWESIAKGLIAMGVALAELVAAVMVMSTAGPMALAGAAAIAIVAPALVVLSTALDNMGQMDWSAIGKIAVLLGTVLLELSIGLTLMIAALPGALALVTVSAGLAAFYPVMMLFADVPWESIGAGLLKIAAVIGVIVAACIPLAVATPVLLAFGVAMTALSASLALIATSLALLSGAVELMVAVGASGISMFIESVKLIVTEVASLIPTVMGAIGEGIASFLAVINDNLPIFEETVINFITTIGNAIVATIPVIVDIVTTLVVSILDAIKELVPEFVDTGWTILMSFLQGINDNIQDVVETGVDIVINFINGVTEKIPDMMQCAVDFILGWIDGLTGAIEDNRERVLTSIDNLILAIVDTIIAVFDHNVELVKEIGQRIMDSGFIQGISDKIQEVKDKAAEIIQKFKNAITDKFEEIKDVGRNLINGLRDGITEKIEDIKESVTRVANNVVSTVKRAFGVKSPSRVFKEIGEYVDLGFIQGLNEFSDKINRTSEEVAEDAIKSFSSTVDSIGSVGTIDIDDPVIRPVIDTSEIERGITRMYSMMDGLNGYEVYGGYSGQISDNVNKSLAEKSESNSIDKLIGAIKDTFSSDRGMVNNFNITGDDPEEIATEVADIIMERVARRENAWA